MNNKFKRILCMILSVVIMLGTFSGCSTKLDETDSDKPEYITHGEFYALFIKNTNMYNEDYSEENVWDYNAAENILYDHFLLDETQLSACLEPVTKEIVAQICIRYMEFRKTGSAEIKDIEKCYDQQAIIDAVGMEIFELENGYFDAKQKMTLEECQSAIDKMLNIELDSHYEEGELEVEFNDNVVVFDESIEITDFGVVENSAPVAPIAAKDDENGFVQLGYNSANAQELAVTNLANNSQQQEMWFSVSAIQYKSLNPKPAVGKVIIKPYFTNNIPLLNPPTDSQPFDLNTPSAIMVTRIKEEPFNVTIYGRLATAEEFLKDSGNEKKINKKNCSKGATIEKVTDNSVPEGIKIDVTSKPGYVIVTFGHKFTLTDKIYSNQTWRNPTASPSMNITAEVGNFKLDTKNIGKLILGKQASAEVKLTYNTRFDLTMKAGGLRYSPANNGNGGLKYNPEDGFSGNFFANLGNSRFTGASAGGSEKIKLAQVNIPLGSGFSINTNLYLAVEFDGSISFVVDSKNAAELKVTKTLSGKYEPAFKTTSEKEKKIDVNANLTLEFQLTPNVSFLGLNLIDAVGKFGGTVNAMASLYCTKENKSSPKVYATKTELAEQCKGNDFKYCISSNFELYLGYDFITKASVIGKFVIDDLGLKTPSGKFVICSVGCHFEDGDYVNKCTRHSDEIGTNDDDDIQLSDYKVVLDTGSQVCVSVNSIPISNKKVKQNGGIAVKSENKKVATVKYYEATNSILITAEGEGSTEITITIPKQKNGKTFYEQKISVTVGTEGFTGVAVTELPMPDSAYPYLKVV